MSAKSELFTRLQFLESAVALPELIDQGIMPNEHNGRANLLRKGLGIVAFNILEDFVKNRTVEGLDALSTSTILFPNLPAKLQEAATLKALNAILFRAKLEKRTGGNWLGLIQTESQKIYSTQNPTFELSRYSLVSSSSNIGEDDIGELLAAFGVPAGWAVLKQVSDRIGGGLPDLRAAYNNAADRRHSAAHSATFQYNHQWLSGIKHEIVTIASAIDILLFEVCRQVRLRPTQTLESHNAKALLKFRFLEHKAGKVRETTTIGGRAKKVWPTLTMAVGTIRPNLGAQNEFLVVLDESKRISDWYY